MNECLNPECQKEIPENKKYCDEECLRKHLEIKKQNKKVLHSETKKEKRKAESIQLRFIDNTREGINEIKEICNIFGLKHSDGNIVGAHNATILGYLRQQQEEVYTTTINKLTWICHTSNRNIRENFLKGIEDFGIIETFTNEFNVLKWRWIGIKALRNNGK